MAGHTLPGSSHWPPPAPPGDPWLLPGSKHQSKTWAFRTNVQSQPWDGSQAPLSSHCLNQLFHQTSELTQQMVHDFEDFCRVSLESFVVQQRQLLQDALANGPPPPKIDALAETPPLQASEPLGTTSPVSVSEAAHYGSEKTKTLSTDHLGCNSQCGTIVGTANFRRPSSDSTITCKSVRSLKTLKSHRTLKDLEMSLNSMLIESQLHQQRGANSSEVTTPKGYDLEGPNMANFGIRSTHLSTVTPVDHEISPAPTVNSRTSDPPPTVNSRTSEGNKCGGLELTAWLRQAHERSPTTKLAEPEIFVNGSEPLAMEAWSPRLSLCGIFLWLHLLGVLPWRFPGKARGRLRAHVMHLNQLLILLVATLTVAFRIGEAVLVRQKIYTINNLLLAVGSFFCVLANWSIHRCNLFKEDQSFLLNYAKEHYFLRSWCWQSLWHLTEVILGWALTVASRASLSIAEGRPGTASALHSVDVVAYSLTTGIFFASTFCQLHCMNALVCCIDRFSLRFTQDPSAFKRIQDWNSLQAMLRQASLAMENCILVLLTTSLLMVFTCGVGSVLDPSFGIVQSMLPVAILWATKGHVLLKRAHVTNRCNRVPPFVTALSADCEVAQLSERFLLVQFMESIAAGFYVKEIKLTSTAAMKLVYAGCMVMTTIFTAGVTGPSGPAMR